MTADDNRPAQGLAGAGPGQSVLLTVRFLTELALIAVLVWAGLGASLPLAGRIVIAVAAPVLAMVIWGLWMAPRARRRLADPLRLVAELVLFAVAAAVLALTGPVLAAVVFAVIAMGVAILLRAVAPGS
ncbi:MAG TPA: YrdB family protein [Streptosporangiaceae bacterium]|nr:YrdB family protein [Streptosporangiaceae bacterium]